MNNGQKRHMKEEHQTTNKATRKSNLGVILERAKALFESQSGANDFSFKGSCVYLW